MTTEKNLVKAFMLRGFIGSLMGVGIAHIIAIILSVCYGTGFSPTSPLLIEARGSALSAVIFQAVLSAVYGWFSAGLSVVWEINGWTMLQKSITHFTVLFLVGLGVGWSCYWFPHEIGPLVMFIVLFVVIFVVIWLLKYYFYQKSIREMNAKIGK